jgi:dihydrofolate reductase
VASHFACGVSPAGNAKSLRVQPDGKVLITDGPCIEAKEHIGGFWILEAADLDEALAWARKGAVACRASGEVREILFCPAPTQGPGGSNGGWPTKFKGDQMRNVIFAINITLDGCCDHTRQIADDETHEYFTQLLREVDLLVFGRKTYQLMVPYWPDVAKSQSETKASNEFAQAFGSKKLVVFSRSLDSVEGNNTRIVRTNLHDEILILKQEQGKDILIGGVSIPSQLIELGLVDEYRFVVGPIVAGEGRRLLEGVNLPEKCRLKLVESKTLKSGCVALRYLKQ